MINWPQIRAQFPAVGHLTYLNTAAGAIMPLSVAEAGKLYYDETAGEGDKFWDEWLHRVEEIRNNTSRFLNCSHEEIAFLTSASQAMSYLSLMFKDQGDVLTLDDEYPSTTIQWLYRGYYVTFVKPEQDKTYSIDAIRKQLTPGTKFIVISHVQSNTGFRIDLEEVSEFLPQ